MPGPVQPSSIFPFPFTAIHFAYSGAFDLYVTGIIGGIETALAPPLLACVTLWVIIQGILVMRGDIAPQQGVTKLVKVAIVVGLVSSSNLYDEYVKALFLGLPDYFNQLVGGFALPTGTIPSQLDLVFAAGEQWFQHVAAEIPPTDELDAVALDGAQLFFFFTLWSIFGVYDIVVNMTTVLVAVGPLFIMGYLFDATADMATKWVGQLVTYAITMLLTLIVATVVIALMVQAATTIGTLIALGATAKNIMLLYELDLFILTGNALVVAVPVVAANIGGGVAASGSQIGQSVYRRFSKYDRPAGVPGKGPTHQIQSLGSFFQ